MEKLINEHKLNELFKTAKLASYKNPKKDKTTDYGADKIFNRLIISMLSFSKHTLNDGFRLFRIDQRSLIDKEIITKWQQEMNDLGIESDKNQMIKILNGYEPVLEKNPIVQDPKSIIPPYTVKRMFEKYTKYSKGSWNNFRILANIVYMRYVTYSAWSQCWTMTPNDRKSVDSYRDKSLLNIELFGAPFNTQVDTYIFGTLFPDTDKPFGGIMRYENLYEYILNENEKGVRFNIQISPPNLIFIIDDLPGKVRELKKNDNNILIMYPWWEDSYGFKEMEKIFTYRKDVYAYLDMFTGKIITGGSRIHSVLFYD
jgi:hypothetical protein